MPESAGRVSQRFDQAAQNYTSQASLQQTIATQLIHRMLNTKIYHACPVLIDLGCGPATYAYHLQQLEPKALIGLDQSMRMLNKVKAHGLTRIAADIRQLPFKAASIDGVFSSYALQWVDFKSVIQRIFSLVRPGGWFVLAVPEQGSLQELRAAWAQIDTYQHVNHFVDYASVISQSDWHLDAVQYSDTRLVYPNLKMLMQHIKSVGANTKITQPRRQRQGLLSRGQWQQLQAAYTTCSAADLRQDRALSAQCRSLLHHQDQWLPLTYRTGYYRLLRT